MDNNKVYVINADYCDREGCHTDSQFVGIAANKETAKKMIENHLKTAAQLTDVDVLMNYWVDRDVPVCYYVRIREVVDLQEP